MKCLKYEHQILHLEKSYFVSLVFSSLGSARPSTTIGVQEDLNSIKGWIAENKMDLAIDKRTNLTFREKNESNQMSDTKLKQHISERFGCNGMRNLELIMSKWTQADKSGHSLV